MTDLYLVSKAIGNFANQTFLTKGQQIADNEARKGMQHCGIVPSGAFTYERRSVGASNNNVGTKVGEFVTPQTLNDLLSMTTYYTNMDSTLTIPFTKNITAQWKQDGYNESTADDIINVTLKPNRLVSYGLYSKDLIKQNTMVEKQIIGGLENANTNKLIATMFSNSTETDDSPKGLFAYKNASSILDVTDTKKLSSLMVNVEKRGVNGIWVCSTTAKQYLYNNHPTLMQNEGYLMGRPIIFDARVQDDYICYVDPKKVMVADWKYNSLTIDPVTKAIDGNIAVTCETFVDFKLLDENYIAIGKVVTSINNTENNIG